MSPTPRLAHGSSVARFLENDFLENDFPAPQSGARATRQAFLPLERGASSWAAGGRAGDAVEPRPVRALPRASARGLRHDERSRSILPSSLRRTVQNTRNAQVSRTAGSRSGRGSTASWSGPTAPGLGSRATCAPASQEQRALCVPPLACVHRSCWRARTSTCPGEASEWMAYRAVPGAGSASPAVAKGCSCRWRRRDRRLGHAAAVAS